MINGTESQTLFIGHRGASFDAPENTMAAIDLAWESGADAVEIDIQLTKDNVIVLFHDDDISRYNGINRPIADYMFKELRQIDFGSFKGKNWIGERIPTLTEVLESVPKGRILVIELKSGGDVIPGLIRLLSGRKGLLQRIIFISFHRDAILQIKTLFPQNIALRIYEPEMDKSSSIWTPAPSQMLDEVIEDKLDGLDISVHPPIDPDFIGQVHKNNLLLAVWTINTPEQARFFHEQKIFGITTDRPVWLRNQLNQ